MIPLAGFALGLVQGTTIVDSGALMPLIDHLPAAIMSDSRIGVLDLMPDLNHHLLGTQSHPPQIPIDQLSISLRKSISVRPHRLAGDGGWS